MSENNNIENIFKDNFNNYSVKPDKSVWNRINRILFYKSFLKFNPIKFNFWYGLSILIISGIIFINPFKNNHLSNGNSVDPETYHSNELVISSNSNQTLENNESNELISKEESNNTYKTETEELKINTTEINNFDTQINNFNNTNTDSNNEGNEQAKLTEAEADFIASEYTACEPAAIEFTNTSKNCDGYIWDFGNGETSSIENPTYVYKTAGTYTVTLKSLSGSFSKTVKKVIKILPKPRAEFTVKNGSNLFRSEKIEFVFTGSNCTNNQWIFGDGNSAKELNTSHTYDTEGKYKVALISFRSECTDTFISTININNEKYRISVPTAFTPELNGPGNGYWKSEIKANIIFYPILNYETVEFRFKIYDKYGNLVFISNDPNYGWNGWYNNKPAPTNVYIWECDIKFIDGETFYKKGNVTLLHSDY